MKFTCRYEDDLIKFGTILKIIGNGNIENYGIVSKIGNGMINVICLERGIMLFDSVSSLEDLEKEFVEKKIKMRKILKNVELIFD